jgi:very-short-patch-repair endonuclease
VILHRLSSSGEYSLSLKKEIGGQAGYEVERTRYFELQGYKAIPQGDDVRFWNDQVENDIADVVRSIENVLED